MAKPLVIGLCGLAGSGKDTVAARLCQKYGFQRLSFAAPIKDAVAAMFGWDRTKLEGATPDDRAWREQVDTWWSQRLGKPITPRAMLQIIGTDCLRDKISSDLWVANVERRIVTAPTDSRFVITDVRFPNEIHALKNLGAILLRIQRGPLPSWWAQAAKGEPVEGVHISESALASHPISSVLFNDGTLDELDCKVDALTTEWLARDDSSTATTTTIPWVADSLTQPVDFVVNDKGDTQRVSTFYVRKTVLTPLNLEGIRNCIQSILAEGSYCKYLWKGPLNIVRADESSRMWVEIRLDTVQLALFVDLSPMTA